MMPVFVMKSGFDQENRRHLWYRTSRGGDDGINCRVRISPRGVYPQYPCCAHAYNFPSLDRTLCPDVTERLFQDNLRKRYEDSMKCYDKNCCYTKGTEQNAAGQMRETQRQCAPNSNGNKLCSDMKKECKTGCPFVRNKSRQTRPSKSTTPDSLPEQPMPDVSLDTLMGHFFEEIFGQRNSDKVRIPQDRSECEKKDSDTEEKTKEESGQDPRSKTCAKQSSPTRNTPEATTTDTTRTESVQSQGQTAAAKDEKPAQSRALNLHDVLGLVFCELLGNQGPGTTGSDARQNTTRQQESSSSGHGPEIPHDVTKRQITVVPEESLNEKLEESIDNVVQVQPQPELCDFDVEINPEIFEPEDVDDDAAREVFDEGEDFTAAPESDKYSQNEADNERDEAGKSGKNTDDVTCREESNQQTVPESKMTAKLPDEAHKHHIPVEFETPKFSMSFDLSGFSPDDIRVIINQDKLNVMASQDITENGITTEHSVNKSVTLPPGVDNESLRCRLHDDGHMIVSADYIQFSGGDKMLIVEKPPKD